MSLRNRNQYDTQIKQEFEHADRRINRLQALNSYVPVGGRVAYDGQTAPQGWLFCDGSQLSRTKYVALFRVMGVTYGAGDGAGSTFNLPNNSAEIVFTGVA